jgi:hypothetical protein
MQAALRWRLPRLVSNTGLNATPGLRAMFTSYAPDEAAQCAISSNSSSLEDFETGLAEEPPHVVAKVAYRVLAPQ